MKRILRFRPQLFVGMIGSTVLALMIALFLAARGTDPARYDTPSEILRQMKTLDAAVNEDAFELHFGLQNSCDALNDKMMALAQLRVRLQASLKVLNSKPSAAIQQALSEVDRRLAAKQAETEQFKTSNAEQANSRYYFPSICEFVRIHDARNAAYPELASELASLEPDVLLYHMSGDPVLSSSVLARISRMQEKEGRLGTVARSDLHSLLLHAAMLVQSKQRVDTHLAILIAIPSAPAYDAVFNHLEKGRQSEFQTTTIYRVALLFVCLLVFAYALKTFLKTRRQARELHSANETLEARVLERTHDIERIAYHDSLTGLPNRASFMIRLEEALERAGTKQQRMALLFIDCDNFKQINDTLGHEAGDEFLKQRATCMRASLHTDDLVARLGGDEFTILLENLGSEESALAITRRVLKNLSKPMNLMGNEIFGGASIGIAFNRESDETVESMLRNADTAMYQVKTSGKGGCIVFEQDMNDRANEQTRIESGLRHALENGELRVYYQPLIDLETGQMSGTEALVRWEHPEWGLLPPGKFIPIAEETGLIVPLGEWVLEEACRQTQQWQAQWPQQPPWTVNVNLSGHQLKRADIVEKIVATVRKTDLPLQCLRLEITESVMMNNLEDAKNKLNRLKEFGIKIALDDFGTGYSSMASLVELPVDSIKIDRSFVARLGDHAQADATIMAIIALAKAYSLEVTGEGVETQDQVALLQSYGCTLGQGYFFAKPLPADTLISKILAKNTSFVNKIAPRDKEYIENLLDKFTDEGNQHIKPAA